MSVRRIAGVVLAATLIVVSATVAPIVQVGAASDRSGSSRDRSSASPVVVSTDTVDLTVTDIRLSPSSPSVEETVEICADIENRGDTTADDVELKFYVDGEFQFIPPTSTVGPGETEDACVLTATFSEGGSHTLTARVDPDDHIAETDEQNNALDTTVTVEREFGVVEGRVTDEGGSPIEGVRVMTDGEQQVTDSEGYYRFEEVTAGTRTVEAYITDYVNEETRIELTDGETERVDFSLARETFTVETSIEPSRLDGTADPDGTYEFGSSVTFSAPESIDDYEFDAWRTESGSLVSDRASWTDDYLTSNYDIVAHYSRPGKPDLAVEDIEIDPPSPRVGESTDIQVEVRNRGDARTSDVPVEVSAGNDVIRGTVESIDPGEEVTFEVDWEAEPETSVTAEVDFHDRIDEYDEGNNRRTEDVSIEERDPNLRVTDIELTPSDPTIGDVVEVAVTIRNDGQADATEFGVLAERGEDRLSETRIDLAAGSSRTLTLGEWTVESTNTEITAEVDFGSAVAEANEGDNTRTESFSVGERQPNFRTRDVTVSPSNPSIGAETRVCIEIANTGETTTTVNVPVIVDGQDRGLPPAVSPAPGESETTCLEAVSFETSGEHRVTAVVDREGSVAETDESDNRDAVTVSVDDDLPDLVVERIEPTPSEPRPGSEVSFAVVVSNRGTASADDVTVTVTVDDRTLERTGLSVVEGETRRISVGSALASDESLDVTARVDPGERVVERSETNNRAFRTVQSTDALPDLEIASVATDPTSPESGDRTMFAVSVANTGEALVTGTSVSLEVGSRGFNERNVRIPPGERRTVEFGPWTAVGSVDTFTVRVDPSDAIAEVNELDNTLTTSLPFSTGGRPELLSAAVEEGTYAVDDELPVSVTLTNPTTSSQSVYVGAWLQHADGSPVGDRRRDDRSVTLAAGATRTVEVTRSISVSGGRYDVGVGIWADGSGDRELLTESVRRGAVEVGTTRLRVASVRSSSDRVDAGTEAEIRVVVENTATIGGEYRLEYRFSQPRSDYRSELHSKTVIVSAGGRKTVSIPWQVPTTASGGQYDVSLTAFEDGSTGERIGGHRAEEVFGVTRESRSTGSVTVTVVDSGGDPVSGATVALEGLDVDEQVTDASGRLILQSVPTGRQTLEVDPPGTGGAATRTIEVEAGGTTVEVPVAVTTGEAVVTGVVETEGGRPVSEATVNVYRTSDPSTATEPVASTTPSGAGLFRFDRTFDPGTRYHLFVALTGFSVRHGSITPESGINDYDVQIPGSVTLYNKLDDPTAVPGALTDATTLVAGVMFQTADPGGPVDFSSVTLPTYSIGAAYEAFVERPEGCTVRDGRLSAECADYVEYLSGSGIAGSAGVTHGFASGFVDTGESIADTVRGVPELPSRAVDTATATIEVLRAPGETLERVRRVAERLRDHPELVERVMRSAVASQLRDRRSDNPYPRGTPENATFRANWNRGYVAYIAAEAYVTASAGTALRASKVGTKVTDALGEVDRLVRNSPERIVREVRDGETNIFDEVPTRTSGVSVSPRDHVSYEAVVKRGGLESVFDGLSDAKATAVLNLVETPDVDESDLRRFLELVQEASDGESRFLRQVSTESLGNYLEVTGGLDFADIGRTDEEAFLSTLVEAVESYDSDAVRSVERYLNALSDVERNDVIDGALESKEGPIGKVARGNPGTIRGQMGELDRGLFYARTDDVEQIEMGQTIDIGDGDTKEIDLKITKSGGETKWIEVKTVETFDGDLRTPLGEASRQLRKIRRYTDAERSDLEANILVLRKGSGGTSVSPVDARTAAEEALSGTARFEHVAVETWDGTVYRGRIITDENDEVTDIRWTESESGGETAPASEQFPVTDGRSDVDAMSAPNDRLEPNDEVETATVVQPDETFTDLVAGDNDVDRFAVTLGERTRLSVTALFDQSRADLEVSVQDPAGTVLGEAASATDNESLTVVTREPGRYVVTVESWGSGTATYDIELTSRAIGTADGEPNDSPATANVLQPGDGIDDGWIVRTEWDYHALSLSRGESVRVTVNATTVVDAYVVSSNGDVIEWGRTAGENDSAVFTVMSHGTGTEYLLLESPVGATGRYSVAVTDVSTSAVDTTGAQEPDVLSNDQLEPNGVATDGGYHQPAVITPGVTYPDLRAIADESDWYAVTPPGNRTVPVNVSAADDDTALTVGVYRSQDGVDPVVEPQTGTDLSLTLDATANETYAVLVTSADDVSVEYSLTVGENRGAGRAPLTVRYDTDGDGCVGIADLNAAIDDYFRGELTVQQLNRLIDSYFACV